MRRMLARPGGSMARIGTILLALCGAACATSYKPHGIGGGFAEYPLDASTYRVSFRGNAYTSRERVQQFLHFRCAELTLEKGYDSFLPFDSDEEARLYVYTSPTQTTTNASGSVTSHGSGANWNGTATTTTTGGGTYVMTKQKNLVTIRMFKGERPDGAFDAREVVQVLGPYVR